MRHPYALPLMLVALLLGGMAPAQTPLNLPAGATATHGSVADPGQYALPTGRFGADATPVETLEGRVHTRAWRLPDGGPGTLALAQSLRPQLERAGFEILLDCATAECGGFDYRIGTRVLPPPAMEVSLTDFRVISARRTGADPAHLNLLISRTGGGGWLQAIEVVPSVAAAPALAEPAPQEPREDVQDEPGIDADPDAPPLLEALLAHGRVVLDGVDFASGAQQLDDSAISALEPLALALRADPDLRVMLVGHSDDTGSLAANIALSRARAAAVRTTLIERFDIDRSRIEAEGAGFLAPRAPNTTDSGRALNRRVEAVLR